MKQLSTICAGVICLFMLVPATVLAQQGNPFEEQPGEFVTRIVIPNVFNHPVFLPKGLNLGQFSVISYKSGNQKQPTNIQMPGELRIKPLIVETGWIEAAPLIRWLNRLKDGKQEKRDIQVYVRNIQSQKNHVHVTLHKCWPSDVTLSPMGDHVPSVLITFQIEQSTCHLPPLLQMIGGAKVIKP